MKILFVTSVIPNPPNNGIRVVPYNAIKMMVELGHTVMLCTLTNEPDIGVDGLTSQARYAGLSNWLAPGSFWMKIDAGNALARLISSVGVSPSFIRRYRHAGFRSKVKECIASFEPDAIHYDFINTTEYVDLAPVTTKTVASINDSMSLAMENRLNTSSTPWFLKLAKKLQLVQIKRYEKCQYVRFDSVHLMTDVDADYLKDLNPEINTVVIPNGVEPSLFDLDMANPEVPTVIFVGELKGNNLDATRDFVSIAWPRILNEIPNARLYLYGGMNRMGEQWLESLSDSLHVSSIGYVNHLKDVYSDASLSVAPIDKDSGIMNKIIESMAARVPVVGFRRSFRSIQYAREGEHFLAGDNFEEIASSIIRLLSDTELRERQASSSRALAAEHFSWASKVDDYLAMYN